MPEPTVNSVNNPPRYRFNAKQTAKGAWQLDVTAETYDGHSPVDLVIARIEEAKREFKAKGLAVVES